MAEAIVIPKDATWNDCDANIIPISSNKSIKLPLRNFTQNQVIVDKNTNKDGVVVIWIKPGDNYAIMTLLEFPPEVTQVTVSRSEHPNGVVILFTK